MIILGIVAAVVLVFVYALCKVASDSDDAMDSGNWGG